MPTRENIEVFDGLLLAAGGLIDMKRQVDRVESEIRTLKAQVSGFVPPIAKRVRERSLQRPRADQADQSVGICHVDGNQQYKTAVRSNKANLRHLPSESF